MTSEALGVLSPSSLHPTLAVHRKRLRDAVKPRRSVRKIGHKPSRVDEQQPVSRAAGDFKDESCVDGGAVVQKGEVDSDDEVLKNLTLLVQNIAQPEPVEKKQMRSLEEDAQADGAQSARAADGHAGDTSCLPSGGAERDRRSQNSAAPAQVATGNEDGLNASRVSGPLRQPGQAAQEPADGAEDREDDLNLSISLDSNRARQVHWAMQALASGKSDGLSETASLASFAPMSREATRTTSPSMSPAEVGRVAADAARAAGGTIVDIAWVAGHAAAERAVAYGLPPAEVAKSAGDAARAAGGLPGDAAKIAGEAAGMAASKMGRSPRSSGKAAAEAARAAGGSFADIARAAGEAAAKAAMDSCNNVTKTAGKTAAPEEAARSDILEPATSSSAVGDAACEQSGLELREVAAGVAEEPLMRADEGGTPEQQSSSAGGSGGSGSGGISASVAERREEGAGARSDVADCRAKALRKAAGSADPPRQPSDASSGPGIKALPPLPFPGSGKGKGKQLPPATRAVVACAAAEQSLKDDTANKAHSAGLPAAPSKKPGEEAGAPYLPVPGSGKGKGKLPPPPLPQAWKGGKPSGDDAGSMQALPGSAALLVSSTASPLGFQEAARKAAEAARSEDTTQEEACIAACTEVSRLAEAAGQTLEDTAAAVVAAGLQAGGSTVQVARLVGSAVGSKAPKAAAQNEAAARDAASAAVGAMRKTGASSPEVTLAAAHAAAVHATAQAKNLDETAVLVTEAILATGADAVQAVPAVFDALKPSGHSDASLLHAASTAGISALATAAAELPESLAATIASGLKAQGVAAWQANATGAAVASLAALRSGAPLAQAMQRAAAAGKTAELERGYLVGRLVMAAAEQRKLTAGEAGELALAAATEAGMASREAISAVAGAAAIVALANNDDEQNIGAAGAVAAAVEAAKGAGSSAQDTAAAAALGAALASSSLEQSPMEIATAAAAAAKEYGAKPSGVARAASDFAAAAAARNASSSTEAGMAAAHAARRADVPETLAATAAGMAAAQLAILSEAPAQTVAAEAAMASRAVGAQLPTVAEVAAAAMREADHAAVKGDADPEVTTEAAKEVARDAGYNKDEDADLFSRILSGKIAAANGRGPAEALRCVAGDLAGCSEADIVSALLAMTTDDGLWSGMCLESTADILCKAARDAGLKPAAATDFLASSLAHYASDAGTQPVEAAESILAATKKAELPDAGPLRAATVAARVSLKQGATLETAAEAATVAVARIGAPMPDKVGAVVATMQALGVPSDRLRSICEDAVVFCAASGSDSAADADAPAVAAAVVSSVLDSKPESQRAAAAVASRRALAAGREEMEVVVEASRAARAAGATAGKAYLIAARALMENLEMKERPPAAVASSAANAVLAEGGTPLLAANAAAVVAAEAARRIDAPVEIAVKAAADAAREAGACAADVAAMASVAVAQAASGAGKSSFQCRDVATEALQLLEGTPEDASHVFGMVAAALCSSPSSMNEDLSGREAAVIAAAFAKHAGAEPLQVAVAGAAAAFTVSVQHGDKPIDAADAAARTTAALSAKGQAPAQLSEAVAAGILQVALLEGMPLAEMPGLAATAAAAAGGSEDCSLQPALQAVLKVSKLAGSAPLEAGLALAEAVKDRSLSSDAVGAASAKAAAEVAISLGRSPTEVATAAAQAADACGSQPADVVRLAAQAATRAATEAEQSPHDAAAAAVEATKTAGLSQQDVMRAAAAAATATALAKGQSAREAGHEAAVAMVSLALGATVTQAAVLAANSVQAEDPGATKEDIMEVVADAASVASQSMEDTPEMGARAAAEALRSLQMPVGTNQSDVASCAGNAAAKISVAQGRAIAEVSADAAGAVRSAGGSTEDVAKAASIAAGLAASCSGRSASEAGAEAAQAAKAAGAASDDVARAAGSAAAAAARAAGKPVAEMARLACDAALASGAGMDVCAEAAVAAVVSAAGTSAAVSSAASDASATAAIALQKSAEEAGSTAANAVKTARGTEATIGHAATEAATRVAKTLKLPPQEAAKAVAAAARAAGASPADAVRISGVAAAEAAIAGGLPTADPVMEAVEAARSQGALPVQLARAAGMGAAQAAVAAGMLPAGVIRAGVEAAVALNDSCAAVPDVVADVAAMDPVYSHLSAVDVGLAAAEAVEAAGGSPADVAAAVARASAVASTFQGQPPSEAAAAARSAAEAIESKGGLYVRGRDIGNALAAALVQHGRQQDADVVSSAIRAARVTGSSQFSIPLVAGEAMSRAAVARGFSTEQVAKLAVETCKAEGGKPEQIAAVAGIAAATSAISNMESPEQAALAAGSATKAAGARISAVAVAAAEAAERVMIAGGAMEPADAATTAADVTRRMGGSKEDASTAAGHAAAGVAIHKKASLMDVEKAAVRAASEAGASKRTLRTVAAAAAQRAAAAGGKSAADIAEAAAVAGRRFDASSGDVAEIIYGALLSTAQEAGLSHSEAARAAVTAAQAVGLSSEEAAEVAGGIATELALAGGLPRAAVVQASVDASKLAQDSAGIVARVAAAACQEAGGSPASAVRAATDAAVQAVAERGGELDDAGMAVAQVVKSMDDEVEESAAKCAASAIAAASCALKRSPAEAGGAAARVARLLDSSPSEAASLAAFAAAEVAITSGKSPVEVARAAAAAAKAAGGTASDCSTTAGEAAASAAAAFGMFPAEVGAVAGHAAKVAGASRADAARAAGRAAADACINAGRTEEEVTIAATAAAKNAGGAPQELASIAAHIATDRALSAGKGLQDVSMKAFEAARTASPQEVPDLRRATVEPLCRASIALQKTPAEAAAAAAEAARRCDAAADEALKIVEDIATTVALASKRPAADTARAVAMAMQSAGASALQVAAAAGRASEAAGGAPVDNVLAIGDASVLMAAAEDMSPDAAADLASKAAMRSGCSSTDAANVAGFVSAEVAMQRGCIEPADVAAIAGAAVKAAGGDAGDAWRVARDAAIDAAAKKQMQPLHAAELVQKLAAAAGEEEADISRAAAETAATVAFANEEMAPDAARQVADSIRAAATPSGKSRALDAFVHEAVSAMHRVAGEQMDVAEIAAHTAVAFGQDDGKMAVQPTAKAAAACVKAMGRSPDEVAQAVGRSVALAVGVSGQPHEDAFEAAAQVCKDLSCWEASGVVALAHTAGQLSRQTGGTPADAGAAASAAATRSGATLEFAVQAAGAAAALTSTLQDDAIAEVVKQAATAARAAGGSPDDIAAATKEAARLAKAVSKKRSVGAPQGQPVQSGSEESAAGNPEDLRHRRSSRMSKVSWIRKTHRDRVHQRLIRRRQEAEAGLRDSASSLHPSPEAPSLLDTQLEANEPKPRPALPPLPIHSLQEGAWPEMTPAQADAADMQQSAAYAVTDTLSFKLAEPAAEVTPRSATTDAEPDMSPASPVIAQSSSAASPSAASPSAASPSEASPSKGLPAPGKGKSPPAKGSAKGPPSPGGKGPPLAGGKGPATAKGGKGAAAPPGGFKGKGGKAQAVEPRKPDVKPAVQVKKLFWSSFRLGTAGENTVWNAIEREGAQIDTAELEALFADEPSFARAMSKEEKAPAANKINKVQVFDSGRRRQICIMLARLPDKQGTCDALLRMDTEKLNKDQIELLVLSLPPPDEVKQFKDAEEKLDEMNVWDSAEEFMHAIIKIPSFQLRLQAWDFENGFQERFDGVSAAEKDISDGFECVLTSPAIRHLLGMVLYAGNYLNGGTPRGRADGFALDTLGQMRTVKMSNQGKQGTLVDYLVRQMHKLHPVELTALFEPGAEAEKFKNASRRSLQESSDEMRVFRLTLDQMIDRVGRASDIAEDETLKGCEGVLRGRAQQMDGLQQRLTKLTEKYEELCMWFHMTDKNTKKTTEEFFGIWAKFMVDIEQALKALLQGMEQERLEEARRNEVARRGRGSLPPGQRRRSLTPRMSRSSSELNLTEADPPDERADARPVRAMTPRRSLPARPASLNDRPSTPRRPPLRPPMPQQPS
eukprot:TRINITY_DN29831_c0_g1_i4.p1 TRINITY_DN29831_c0_g1~~TRINITY_DN29831_c0_g1_i4.p1  ORF type:complete len:3994 (+),score=1118.53 TRINITY_DN29831_c0_g1_i4:210-12191(+)